MFIKRCFQICLLVAANSLLQVSARSSIDLEALKLSNCRDPLEIRLCCFKRKFRTFDGSCNNLCNTTQGAAFSPFQRFIPAEFENGDQPRIRSANGGILPNTRSISVNIFNNTNADLNGRPSFNHITMTWGQFVDHDVTLTEANETVECGVSSEPCPNTQGCTGVNILPREWLLGNRLVRCIPLRRSAIKNREQINLLSDYLDASQVYGANVQEADFLRDRIANIGLLRVRPFPGSSEDDPILPKADPEVFCRSPKPTNKPCFLGGDFRRVNENPALMAMHTLWVREHNRIARYLHILNPTWKDERLFQEARKIVIAEIQRITYNEFLPALFPSLTGRIQAGIALETKGFFNGYNPKQNAEIMNSFSTAAFRMGHSLVRNTFELLNITLRRIDDPILTRDYFNPARLYNQSTIAAIFVGLIGRRAREPDIHFVNAIREQLIIEGPAFNGFSGDLTAINMIRGRDHGLPPYNAFRKACGLNPLQSFYDKKFDIPFGQLQRMGNVYENVDDVDLFGGAMSELPAPGSVLGSTFTCIIKTQFRFLRKGDRFWHERDDPHAAFTIERLTEIRKTSLARVICDNVEEVEYVVPQVFQRPNRRDNRVTRCCDLRFVNLNVFKEDEFLSSCTKEPEEPAVEF